MRKSVFYVVALAISLATFAVTFGAWHSSASTASRVLTITPTTEKPIIQPGSSITGHFQIVNQGQSDYPVRVYAAPYSIHNEEYNPDFIAAPGKPNVADWLHFTLSESEIKQNQTVTVGYTITVP